MAKKGRMKMPVDVSKLTNFASTLGESRNLPVYINLVFDITAGDKLIDLVLKAFAARREDDVFVEHVILENDVPELPLPADLCVVVGGQSLLLGDVASASRAMGTPTVVLIASGDTWFVESAAEACAITKQDPAAHKGIPVDDVVDVDVACEERPLEELGRWIVNHAPAKRLSMAEYFPFLRHPFSTELIKAGAARAAAVGVLIFIPGADMPAITFEQAQMVLQIASVYGQPLDSSRIAEIGAVVAGGFCFRTIARELADFIPGLGWLIKGGIAYSGTVAMGYAALDYFEGGGVIDGVAAVMQQAVEQVSGAVSSALGQDDPESSEEISRD